MRRRGLVGPGIVTLIGLAALLALGTWQLERKAWKETLNATLALRAAAAPVGLPARPRWSELIPANDEFRRVAFRAEFIHPMEAFVYTVGSPLRPDVSGPGYWVFTPARLSDGALVVVNRGYIPQDRLEAYTRAEGHKPPTVDIVGALRWPEPRGMFTPNDEPWRKVWFVRDHRAIAAALGVGEVAPFYIDQEAPVPNGGLPQAGVLSVRLRNDHLQYVFTWYGLALVLAVVFAIWARGRWRATSGH
jgi:surfeit locus 1 family protein